MKPYEGFKSEASGGAYPMLPVGAYVAGIKNVKIEGTEPDQTLVLRLDIIEGEYAGYYTKRYEHDSKGAGFQNMYEAKYKGDFRIRIPNPANTKSQHPEWDIKGFNNMVWCVESSNIGYRWDWNENGLKGKVVGINVRRGFFNGNEYTQIGRLEVADDVRKGLVRPMRDKNPGGTAAVGTDEAAGFTAVETEELPF